MPLFETECLVIKSYDLSDADRIVVGLTREHGVVRGVAKGAKRLKSKFGSGLEPFSLVQLSYFAKDAVELVSIQRADLVKSNFAAVSEPAFLQKFAYIGEVLLSMLPPHDPNEKLYRMVNACLDAASNDLTILDAAGVYFELWILRLSGYWPDWSLCDECRRALEPTDQASLRANFHVLCDHCRRSAGRIVTPEARRLAEVSRTSSPTAFAAAAHPDDLRALSPILRDMISQAVGREVVPETSLAISNSQ